MFGACAEKAAVKVQCGLFGACARKAAVKVQCGLFGTCAEKVAVKGAFSLFGGASREQIQAFRTANRMDFLVWGNKQPN
ncbi:hypothetical protein D3H35_15235 [Cohnella faecalis]|uniref:Uncharacterized protein n=1 Tax=Cohnella faecalis TaxID=2315694 RepID=A0A398CRX3_9BACL|nr:hypothetical protein D3H35_15235 [Cohnella faecalis]